MLPSPYPNAGGAVSRSNFSSVIAGLPEAEREEFFADIRAWWDAHPEERAAIVASDTAARELHEIARGLEEPT